MEVRGTHTVYRIVGGAPLLVKYWEDIGGRHPVRQISRRRFDRLRAVPAAGTLVYTATGTAYRIAGGFPFTLTAPGTRSSGGLLIDLWDIRHLSNPEVHLHATPSDGTLVHAAPSGQFWTFENGHLFPSHHGARAVSVPAVDLKPWLSHCSRAEHRSDGHSGGAGFGGSCSPGPGGPGTGNTGGGGV